MPTFFKVLSKYLTSLCNVLDQQPKPLDRTFLAGFGATRHKWRKTQTRCWAASNARRPTGSVWVVKPEYRRKPNLEMILSSCASFALVSIYTILSLHFLIPSFLCWEVYFTLRTAFGNVYWLEASLLGASTTFFSFRYTLRFLITNRYVYPFRGDVVTKQGAKHAACTADVNLGTISPASQLSKWKIIIALTPQVSETTSQSRLRVHVLFCHRVPPLSALATTKLTLSWIAQSHFLAQKCDCTIQLRNVWGCFQVHISSPDHELTADV